MSLLWLPIDIPKFPIQNFDIDAVVDWSSWKFIKLTTEENNPYHVSDFKSEIKEKFPELIQWFSYFPYVNIRNIKFNIQQRPVKLHIDFTKPDVDNHLFVNNSQNEPCGYRILIKGKRSNTMYVINNNEKIYTTLPDSTDVYVLRHSDGLHGVDDDNNRTTIFTHFEINPVKHSALLEKSLKKYHEYAIFSN